MGFQLPTWRTMDLWTINRENSNSSRLFDVKPETGVLGPWMVFGFPRTVGQEGWAGQAQKKIGRNRSGKKIQLHPGKLAFEHNNGDLEDDFPFLL